MFILLNNCYCFAANSAIAISSIEHSDTGNFLAGKLDCNGFAQISCIKAFKRGSGGCCPTYWVFACIDCTAWEL